MLLVKSVKTFYWSYMPNFGDALNNLILPELFNISPVWTRATICEFLPIGSILDKIINTKYNLKLFLNKYLRPAVNIWGCGCMYEPTEKSFFNKRIKIHAFKLDFPITYVEINNDSTSYLDIEIMKNCKYHINSNSSFSW